MRLDNLLAQEKISRKAMKQALLRGEILVDGCPARSLAQKYRYRTTRTPFSGPYHSRL